MICSLNFISSCFWKNWIFLPFQVLAYQKKFLLNKFSKGVRESEEYVLGFRNISRTLISYFIHVFKTIKIRNTKNVLYKKTLSFRLFNLNKSMEFSRHFSWPCGWWEQQISAWRDNDLRLPIPEDKPVFSTAWARLL